MGVREGAPPRRSSVVIFASVRLLNSSCSAAPCDSATSRHVTTSGSRAASCASPSTSNVPAPGATRKLDSPTGGRLRPGTTPARVALGGGGGRRPIGHGASTDDACDHGRVSVTMATSRSPILGAEVGAELAGCQNCVVVLLRARCRRRARCGSPLRRPARPTPASPVRGGGCSSGEEAGAPLPPRSVPRRLLPPRARAGGAAAGASRSRPPAAASPTLRVELGRPPSAQLLAARVPLAFTSYHAPEAGLDARTLAALGARVVVRAAAFVFRACCPIWTRVLRSAARTPPTRFLALCAGEPPRRGAWFRRA